MKTNEYSKMIKDLQAKKLRQTKAIERESRIVYRKVARDMTEQLDKTPENSINHKWLNSYVRQLEKQIDKISTNLGDMTKARMREIAEAANKPQYELFVSLNDKYSLGMGNTFDSMFSRVADDVVREILSGKLYKDNLGLDERLWLSAKSAKSNIQRTILEGIVSKKSARDLAYELRDYVDPDNKTQKQINYQAERLARTSIQHSYQMAQIRSCQDNPFIDGIEWNSVMQHGRTCQLCIDRHGNIYPTVETPLDHPNGLCYTVPVITKSFNQIGQELKDWTEGQDNPSIDKWVGNHSRADGEEVKSENKIEPKPKSKKEKSYADKISEIKARGNPSEADIQEAGKLIREQVVKTRADVKGNIDAQILEARNKYEATDIEIQKYYRKRNAATTEKDWGDAVKMINKLTPQHEKDFEHYKSLVEKRKGTRETMFHGAANNLKGILSEVRSMGSDGLDIKGHFGNSRSPARKYLEDAYDVYPTDWIEKSMVIGKIKPSMAERGFYRDWTGEIALSSHRDDAGRFGTSVHELGHRFEEAVPGLLDAETNFYKRRTKGEDLTWLGGNYSKSEKTRLDNFVNKYMGKDYGGDAYELASMGFQYAYTEPELLLVDEDMADWIYGILALL